MDTDMQKQFVGWLAQKLQAKDEQDLRDKMQKMGQSGIKQAYQAFMQEQQQGATDNGQDASATPMQRLGGKLDYIRCLQAFKRGGKMEMDKCGCGGKMQDGGMMGEMNAKQSPKRDYVKARKHQQGGTFYPVVPEGTSIQTDKGNGRTSTWGNPIQGAVKSYPLHPSAGSAVNQINEQHLMHLRSAVPGFDNIIGQPMANGYGPQQSDNIRKLMAAYPMPNMQPTAPQSQALTTHKKGGQFKGMGRNDNAAKMIHKKDSRKDQPLDEHAQGERNDSGFRNHAQGSRKDFSEMGNQKGSRKDIESMPHNHGKRLEGKKKVKNYVGFAKGGKMDPKNYQDGDAIIAKKGAKISAADKKDIMMKKMDMKKSSKAMGGSFQPVPTPANATQRMLGKGKKKAMEPTPMSRFGGTVAKKASAHQQGGQIARDNTRMPMMVKPSPIADNYTNNIDQYYKAVPLMVKMTDQNQLANYNNANGKQVTHVVPSGDPRIKAYQDSLAMYNAGQQIQGRYGKFYQLYAASNADKAQTLAGNKRQFTDPQMNALEGTKLSGNKIYPYGDGLVYNTKIAPVAWTTNEGSADSQPVYRKPTNVYASK